MISFVSNYVPLTFISPLHRLPPYSLSLFILHISKCFFYCYSLFFHIVPILLFVCTKYIISIT